ncbi:tripartite tricarboxylate transporter permease [Sporomusa sp.]|uniref:tripartite tricarboxylate transporter permease n=1 Tax=Sporomusa sp. TaxID=2078658 RepID=UPI002B62DAC9|nr:tripartite tricarboxylate transporter permease [Sporomusa sp.]HWR41917.1 tripartite tricarboxylate transporter permease [Sporomusa sp.]
MDIFMPLFHGFETALTGWNLFYCLLGVTIGMLVGILPGLGPTTGIALLLPITFSMDAIPAIIMLSGIYYGAMYGGTVTSVLINTPGEAASVATCFDGYPMAKQGRAGTALGIAGIGSFIGGTVSMLGLVFIGPPLAEMALQFGPPEFFALMVLGLVMVIGLMGKSLVRGLIATLIGLSLSMVGMDPLSGVVRFTFGEANLMEGFDFVVISMGLFGISEVMIGMETALHTDKIPKVGKLLPNREEWAPTLKAIARATGLGFAIGLIPGSNSVIPAILSYSIEKKLAKDPSRFGKGAIEGVAGPETANNSYCGGALIPLFTIGIPSSPTIAILFGAFIMHGLTPGPTLFQNNANFVWAVIASMFVGNLILLIMNLPMAGMWGRVATISPSIMYPGIVIISVVGAYCTGNRIWDVWIMIIFGIIGYIMKKIDIPMAPIVLTFVLGKMIENSLVQSLIYFDGSMLGFTSRPMACVLLIIALMILTGSIVAGIKNKRGILANDVEM